MGIGFLESIAFSASRCCHEAEGTPVLAGIPAAGSVILTNALTRYASASVPKEAILRIAAPRSILSPHPAFTLCEGQPEVIST